MKPTADVTLDDRTLCLSPKMPSVSGDHVVKALARVGSSILRQAGITAAQFDELL